MSRFDVTKFLADWSARRPLIVISVWLVLVTTGLLLTAGVIGPSLSNVLTTQVGQSGGSESSRASQMLADDLQGPEQARETVVVRSPLMTVYDPQFQAFTQELVAGMRALPDTVGAAINYYETKDPALVSADKHTLIIPVILAGDPLKAADSVGPLIDYLDGAASSDFQVLTAGRGSIDRTTLERSEADARHGEMIGVPVALVILVLVFGALAAAVVPIALALTAIGVSTGSATLVGQVFSLNVMAVNMISMIGLAVGIDYSLFIIHRFREERAAGHSVRDAVSRTGSTANRAVLFSGATVVVALLGLLIVPSDVFRSLAIAAITAASLAVLAALTLLPAVLSLAGDRIDWLRLPFLGRHSAHGGSDGPWAAITRIVTRKPWLSAAAATAVLLAAAAPIVTMNQGLAGVETLPESAPPRVALEIVQREFSGGTNEPAQIVVRAADVGAPAIDSAVKKLSAALASDSSFGKPSVQANTRGDLLLVSVPIIAPPDSDGAYDAVNRLRNDYVSQAFAGVDAEVNVGGRSAHQLDFFHVLGTFTPGVFAFVLGVSFILLLFVFRSIVVPVKALVMNLLSTAAAYGILVLVFQHGIGAELLGFQRARSIEAWLPLFLFVVLFGLSMDYHVFLLSRIRERFDQTGDAAASVIFGMRTTSGIITGAALIMVAVFAGFAMGDLGPLQQVGFGLAVAVILDATIVRTVLVPATMHLLGTWNWYLPFWLRWMPEVRLEGARISR